MAAQIDFWGEILTAKVRRTPLVALREQAALLGPKTKNLVEATVDTRVSEGTFIHRFSLVVPVLDGYTYELFAVTHGIRLYPVRVRETKLTLPSEAAFLSWLRRELSSAKTKTIIANLLAQATS